MARRTEVISRRGVLAGIAVGAALQLRVAQGAAATATADSSTSQDDAAARVIGRGQRVLIAGASGRTGGRLVQSLLARGYAVRGLARNIEKARAQWPAAEWVAADLKKPESLGPVARGADAIVFAVGANVSRDPTNIPEKVEFGGVKALVDQGKQAGTRNFVMMSSGGVGTVDPTATTGFAGLLRWKKDAENYVRASGLSYSIVRPSSLIDEDGGKYGIGIAQGNPVWVNLPTITRGDVADVLLECILNPAVDHRTFEIFNAPTHAPLDWKKAIANLKID